MLRKKGLWWLLALPFYELIGISRHEGSHALAALLEGIKVIDASILPASTGKVLPMWGWVIYSRSCGWVTTAAPYLCDVLFFGITLLFLSACRIRRRWIWLNVVIIGLLSPLVNSLYNYGTHFWRRTDITRLMADLPPAPVHLFFWLTMLAYAAGLVFVLRRRAGEEGMHVPRCGALGKAAAVVWCGFFALAIAGGLLLQFYPKAQDPHYRRPRDPDGPVHAAGRFVPHPLLAVALGRHVAPKETVPCLRRTHCPTSYSSSWTTWATGISVPSTTACPARRRSTRSWRRASA